MICFADDVCACGDAVFGDEKPLFVVFSLQRVATHSFWAGFVCHKGSYLRDAWNIMDFIIVLVYIFII